MGTSIPPPATPLPPFFASAFGSSRASPSPGSSSSWSTCSGCVRALNPARKNRRRAPPAAVGGESPAAARPPRCPRLAVKDKSLQAVCPRGGLGLAPSQRTAVPPPSSPSAHPPHAPTIHPSHLPGPPPLSPKLRGPGGQTSVRSVAPPLPGLAPVCTIPRRAPAAEPSERQSSHGWAQRGPRNLTVSLEGRAPRAVEGSLLVPGPATSTSLFAIAPALSQCWRRWSCRPRCTPHVT